MGNIHTINDAKEYILRICKELEEFSEGGEVVTALNGSRESAVTAGILRAALRDRAVVLDLREVRDEKQTVLERVLAVYSFWRAYIEEHGPVAYCFGVTEEGQAEWNRVSAAAGIDPENGKGLFSRRFEALHGVTAEELGLLEKSLQDIC